MQNVVFVISPEPSSAQALGAALDKPGHKVRAFHDSREVLRAICLAPPTLLVVDVQPPATESFSLLNQLSIEKLSLDVLAVVPADEPDLVRECLKRGAAGCITRPFDEPTLDLVIRRTCEKQILLRENEDLRARLEERTSELTDMHDSFDQMFRSSMDTLLRALDWRERETKSHSCRVALAAVAIARQLGLSRAFMRRVLIGGLLHDIGKIGVPDSILMKPGPLTDEEWSRMRCHPEMGCDIVMKTALLGDAKDVVLYHHERFDGAGYPGHVGKDEIPLPARIFSIADTLDAITSKRPYREAQSFQHAVIEIQNCSGTQFDPEVVKAFLKLNEGDWNKVQHQAEVDGWKYLEAAFSPHSAAQLMTLVCP